MATISKFFHNDLVMALQLVKMLVLICHYPIRMSVLSWQIVVWNRYWKQSLTFRCPNKATNLFSRNKAVINLYVNNTGNIVHITMKKSLGCQWQLLVATKIKVLVMILKIFYNRKKRKKKLIMHDSYKMYFLDLQLTLSHMLLWTCPLVYKDYWNHSQIELVKQVSGNLWDSCSTMCFFFFFV